MRRSRTRTLEVSFRRPSSSLSLPFALTRSPPFSLDCRYVRQESESHPSYSHRCFRSRSNSSCLNLASFIRRVGFTIPLSFYEPSFPFTSLVPFVICFLVLVQIPHISLHLHRFASSISFPPCSPNSFSSLSPFRASPLSFACTLCPPLLRLLHHTLYLLPSPPKRLAKKPTRTQAKARSRDRWAKRKGESEREASISHPALRVYRYSIYEGN